MHHILSAWAGEYKPVMYKFFTGGPVIVISDVEIVETIYTTKNCYFDKHPLVKQLCLCLTGESILFTETTKEWKDARKIISPSLYKGKLEGLTELTKETVKQSVKRFRSLIKDGEGCFDLIQEVNTTLVRVLLVCALGEDVSEEKIDYWRGCRKTQVSVAYSLRETFHQLIDRMTSVHVFFFPFMANTFLTPSERNLKANAKALRKLIGDIVDRRRSVLANDPSQKNKGDFLTILLTEPFFMNNQ